MVTLNELCNSTSVFGSSTDPLREACALPRSPEDMKPLPLPHAEEAFDSSWETLLAGVGAEQRKDD
jgi:hypothetical protein